MYFLKLNNCKLVKKINLSSIKLPINHWIYNEFIITQNLIAARKHANKEIRADANFKREQSIQDLTLATAIRKVQVEAQKANTADERNRLLEIQYQLELIEGIIDPVEKKKRLDALLGGSSSGLAALNEAAGAK